VKKILKICALVIANLILISCICKIVIFSEYLNEYIKAYDNSYSSNSFTVRSIYNYSFQITQQILIALLVLICDLYFLFSKKIMAFAKQVKSQHKQKQKQKLQEKLDKLKEE
jgi:uncharacterized membrane protein